MKYTSELSVLHNKVIKFLNKAVKSRINFIAQKEDGDVDLEQEEFYELPIVVNVTKHGFYEEYAIIAISKSKDNELVIHGFIKGEGDEMNRDFTINDLYVYDLCEVADLVHAKL